MAKRDVVSSRHYESPGLGHRMQTSYRDIPAFKSSDGSAAQVL